MEANDLDYVRLDVGGHLFSTHKNTLSKFEDSMLAKLVEPENDYRKSSEEFITIDRDGRLFNVILKFLSDGCSPDLDSMSDKDLSELNRESDYYNLIQLVDLCDKELEWRNNHPRLPQIVHQIYLSRSELIANLTKRQETAVILSLKNLERSKLFNNQRILQLTALCFPVPVYFHIEDHNLEALSIFHRNEIVYTTQCEQQYSSYHHEYIYILSESKFQEVPTKVREDYVTFTLRH